MVEANDLQVGGTHYKDVDPQPWDVIRAWNMGFLDGNALKYLARWHKKGDPLGDLKKAQHYISKLIEEVEAWQAKQKADAEAQDAQQAAARFAPDPEASPVEQVRQSVANLDSLPDPSGASVEQNVPEVKPARGSSHASKRGARQAKAS